VAELTAWAETTTSAPYILILLLCFVFMPTKIKYGAGEYLGRNLASLAPDARAALHHQQTEGPVVCPSRQSCYGFDPHGVPNNSVNCSKKGGFCSVRRYQAEFLTNQNSSLLPESIQAIGTFSTICPHRFLEGGIIYSWIGAELLGTAQPRIVRELPFLEDAGAAAGSSDEDEAVGRIDCVLVRPDAPVLTWCAVEMQAVYLSNSKTGTELNNIAASALPIPFPVTNPRPDNRSSGPKRLLPQLQVKVPTLSRWGIKMAVVVDQEFYNSLGEMEYANHPSNSDIAWFVLQYAESADGTVNLQPGNVHYTTLTEAIDGLVGADPIPKPAFEQGITARLQANYPA
jgi:hypothetical protein